MTKTGRHILKWQHRPPCHSQPWRYPQNNCQILCWCRMCRQFLDDKGTDANDWPSPWPQPTWTPMGPYVMSRSSLMPWTRYGRESPRTPSTKTLGVRIGDWGHTHYWVILWVEIKSNFDVIFGSSRDFGLHWLLLHHFFLNILYHVHQKRFSCWIILHQDLIGIKWFLIYFFFEVYCLLQ